MVEYRELNDDERKFMEKNLEANVAECSHLKLLNEHNQFMLDKMLYSNYLEKVRGFQKQVSEYASEISILEGSIEVANKQLDVGVEIIELAEEAEVVEEVSMVE